MRRTYALDYPFDSPDEVRALLGGKAANLARMLGPDLRLPVPPGFAITTEACREFLAGGWPDGPRRGAPGADGRGRGGDGPPVRRPGRPAAGQRPLRRAGVDARDDGHDPQPRAERRHDRGPRRGDRRPGVRRGVPRPARRRCSPSIVGVEPVPDDPWRQLRLADRGRVPLLEQRPRHRLPRGARASPTTSAPRSPSRRWCSATAARTRGPASCSRATRRPASPCCTATCCSTRRARTSSPARIATEPMRVLDDAPARRPRARCAHAATRLEHHLRDLCDIEFTIEQGRLWLLQVRVGKRSPQAALRIAVDMAEDPAFPLSRARGGRARRRRCSSTRRRVTTGRSGYVLPLLTGLGASPGRRERRDRDRRPTPRSRPPRRAGGVILVRAETSPDDVHGMARAAGILTAPRRARQPRRGGRAGLGHPRGRRRGRASRSATAWSRSAGGRLHEGEVITIDGASGEVFAGVIPGRTEVVPEAAVLLGWAARAGHRDRRRATSRPPGAGASGGGAATP